MYNDYWDWICTSVEPMKLEMIVAVMIIETEIVPRCKQWRYEWSSWLWLWRLSFYHGVNNDVMNDRRGYVRLNDSPPFAISNPKFWSVVTHTKKEWVEKSRQRAANNNQEYGEG